MKRRERGSSGQKSISPKSTESAKENRGREINMGDSLKWKQKDKNRQTEIDKQKQKNRNRKTEIKNRNIEKQKAKNRNKKQKHRKTESESCRTQFISSNQIRSSKNETISL